MDWKLLLINIVVTGILLYVFQKVIDERASKRTEKFKANLQELLSQRQTQFTKLHKERARVIAKLYKKLFKAERSLLMAYRNTTQLLRGPDISLDTVREKSKQSFETALKFVLEFQFYFEENCIFLDTSLCTKVEDVIHELILTSGYSSSISRYHIN